ncbi:MAG TPA: hypothetical protein VFD63_23635 [Pyrinomonadaceae bacterium]|jgi:hypothetical protein|nr:hypothetical protein [Pyrinomonadaceae bacterium]
MTDPKRELLRHTVATLAYRGSKAIRDSGEDFGAFTCGPDTRTPLQILAHIGDLLEWGLSLAKGEQIWRNSSGESWSKEALRFHACLEDFDNFLASEAELRAARGNVLDFVSAMEHCSVRDAALRVKEWFQLGESELWESEQHNTTQAV